jgi:hypothetical protein
MGENVARADQMKEEIASWGRLLSMGSAYALPVPAHRPSDLPARYFFTRRELSVAVALAILAAVGVATAFLLPRPPSTAPLHTVFLTPVSTTALPSSRAPQISAPTP